jgi:hypothetical protein
MATILVGRGLKFNAGMVACLVLSLTSKVTFEAGRITIQTDVAPLPEGGCDCQSNDFVPITVELQERVGDRELFDAICLDSDRLTHSYCMDGGVRWRP